MYFIFDATPFQTIRRSISTSAAGLTRSGISPAAAESLQADGNSSVCGISKEGPTSRKAPPCCPELLVGTNTGLKLNGPASAGAGRPRN